MTIEEAKKIGSTQALKAIGVGILIAQILMTLLNLERNILGSFLWFWHVNYILNIIIGIVSMFFCGYFFGAQAGVEILIKNKNYKWVGFKYGIITLFLATFIASWVGFFQEGFKLIGTDDNPFFDYIYKPVFGVLFFGIIPVIFVGFWFGKQIKKRNNYHSNTFTE